jgi:hypothetical protein
MADQQKRVRTWREILTVVMARQGAPGTIVETATVEARLTGMSSLLRVSLQLTFFAFIKQTVTFAECSWSLYGLVTDATGEFAQLSATPINDGGDIALPEGWEGSAGLEGIRVVAALAQLNGGDPPGEWRLSAVLEPRDACMPQSMFDELVAKVSLVGPSSVPRLGQT